MIIIIELEQKDVKNFDVYKAFELVAMGEYEVVVFENEMTFRENIMDFVDEFDVENLICYIDTKKKIFQIRVIRIDASIYNIEDSDDVVDV